MRPVHSIRRVAALVLFLGLSAFFVTDAVQAAGKAEEARRFTEQLRTTKDLKKKVEALEELGKLGQIQKMLVADAQADIVKSLEAKEPEVRKAAAEAYGKMDPDPKEAVPALLKILKDDKEEMARVGAARGLGYMR
ncbi:MAG: HEAT repeat domain-containing protein, partial [Gemmataceae bacterium]